MNLSLRKGEMIAFRVDGSSKIGTGHLSRCLTLAGELAQRGLKSLFCVKRADRRVIKEILSKGFKVHRIALKSSLKEDSLGFAKELAKRNCRVAVLDGYGFGGRYLQPIRREIPFILSIDDMAESGFLSDVVLNQNISASRQMYRGKVDKKTKLLLGPKYALLRSEFMRFRRNERTFSSFKNILMTFGGADPFNFTLKTLKAVEKVDQNFSVTVVLGIANPHARRIRAYAARMRPGIHVLSNVSNMAQLMAQADLAITSGGSTSWELCCLGLPALQIIMAENQKNIVRTLDRAGITMNLGWHRKVTEKKIAAKVAELIFDSKKRKRMSAAGRTLVDGLGVQRVADVLLASSN